MVRPLTSTVIFQSYIALGLEPGTSWDEVRTRHKDLIMAWHPDRFVDDKQKGKAEDELKKINAARDVLRRHFHKEHTESAYCPCRAQTDSRQAPAASANTARSQQTAEQHQQSQPFQPAMPPAALFKSQLAATTALVLLSLATVAVYHGLATGTRPQTNNNQSSHSYRESTAAPASPASDQALPPAETNATEPDERQATTGNTSHESDQEESSQYLHKRYHAVPGTFYAGFSAHQEQREQQRAEAKRLELNKLLTRNQEALAITTGQVSELEKKLPGLDKEIEQHQSLMNEISQVNSDLETPAANRSNQDAINLYLTNPDYKRHADALRDLASQKQSLAVLILRLKQQMEQSHSACLQIEDELARLQER